MAKDLPSTNTSKKTELNVPETSKLKTVNSELEVFAFAEVWNVAKTPGSYKWDVSSLVCC